jgi:hypothetical protein
VIGADFSGEMVTELSSVTKCVSTMCSPTQELGGSASLLRCQPSGNEMVALTQVTINKSKVLTETIADDHVQ